MQVRYRYQKETPTHVFSCEICEIAKNIFFYKTPPAAASLSASNKCSMPLENIQNSCKEEQSYECAIIIPSDLNIGKIRVHNNQFFP